MTNEAYHQRGPSSLPKGREPVNADSLLLRAPVLLATKLHPPGGRRGAVIRPVLHDRLGQESSKLVVVVAPAGWGKTTLLGDWSMSGGTFTSAWLSLDSSDNDPVRFWIYVIAALRTALPGFGTTPLSVLSAPGSSIIATVLPMLANELADLTTQVILVLDDYHLITNEEILGSMTTFVDLLPPSVRLVLATRADPALPLARLRARGDMAEIRATDLRFTDAEATELFNGVLGLALTPKDIVRLQQRTEGWAAGLYLAGLSLRGRTEPSRFIEAFAGDDRQVADYLVTEVLDRLPAEVRSFLLKTSVLDRLCGSLCDAVLQAEGSEHTLEAIEQSNAFLVPLDSTRKWYRYHHLFGELLSYQLARTDPGLPRVLHRRACAWHVTHGSIAEAIDHALAAGELIEARELAASHWNAYFNEGLVATVESWLNRLPPEMVVEDSRLCVMRAWLARHLGRLDEVEPWLESAEVGVPQGPIRDDITSIESAVCMIRSGYCHMVGDLASAERPARRAVELEASGAPNWRAVSLVTLGVNLFWRGQDLEALDVLQQAIPPHLPPANNLAGLWTAGLLAGISARAGDIETAHSYIRRAFDLATKHHLDEYGIAATTWITSAEVLEREGQMGEAESAALRGLELARRVQAQLETACALLCVARIRLTVGKINEAQEQLCEAREILAACPDPGPLAQLLVSTEQAFKPRPRTSMPRGRPVERLSDRERTVLKLLGSQLSLREIAGELFVSYNTVKTQTRNIYRKLQVSTRQEAVARAQEGVLD